MKSWLKIVVAVLSLGAFLLAFQNCGDEVTFSSGDPQLPIGTDSNIQPISEEEVERLIEDVIDQTPVVDIDGNPHVCDTEAQKEVALFTGDAKQAECKEVTVSPKPKEDNPKDTGNDDPGKDPSKNPNQDPGKGPGNDNGKDIVVDVDPEDYIKLCSYVKMLAEKFKSGDSILLNKASKNSKDVLIHSVPDTDVIANFFGSVLIFPVDDKKMSNVNLIENIRGIKVFCGLKVKKLQNITGATIVVNSEIDELENINGKLVLIRSIINGQKLNTTNNIQEF